jgi:hypothetical protein
MFQTQRSLEQLSADIQRATAELESGGEKQKNKRAHRRIRDCLIARDKLKTLTR